MKMNGDVMVNGNVFPGCVAAPFQKEGRAFSVLPPSDFYHRAHILGGGVIQGACPRWRGNPGSLEFLAGRMADDPAFFGEFQTSSPYLHAAAENFSPRERAKRAVYIGLQQGQPLRWECRYWDFENSIEASLARF